MIRNIAGIMADEEPRAPISPSGLYNTSDLFSSPSDGFLSDVSLSGLGEFTFMCWVYLISPSSNITVYREISSTLRPLYFLGSGSVSVSFDNSNSGVTTLQYPYTREVNEWHHWTVTGSVSNGRLRLYKDGILVQSAVMTYANEISSSSRIDNDSYYLSQMNMFNRELSEAEVAEHYVYDDDTMTSGVLGFDAMTPAQRSGLIYSSSFTKDISRSGNEFTDKSGNNITLSPQPTLTGQQIYIYTDANDLPNGGDVPVVSPVDSLTLFNDADYVTGTKSTTLANQSDQTWSIRVMIPDLTSRTSHNVFTLNYDAPSARSSLILIEQDGTVKAFNFPVVGSTSGSQSISATNAITSGVWHDITVVFDVTGANNFSLYVDNVFYQGGGTGGSVGNSATYDLGIGTRWSTKTSDMEGYLNNLRIWDRALTPAERAENYNGSATEYVCYDKLVSDGSSLVSGLVFDSSLEDATLTENTVNSTLTASGTPTYTDQGMTKLCGGTPT